MEEHLLLLALSLPLGLAVGYVLHRSDYCVAGMFRDLFLFPSTTRLQPLALLLVASMILFEGARHLDVLPYYPFLLAGMPSLGSVVGGFLFGVGMVLAGGCVVGTLYKMGSGSGLSMVAFAGLLLGSALYAEFHPFWLRLSSATALPVSSPTLPGLLGVPPLWLVAAGTIAFAAYAWRQGWNAGWSRPGRAAGYLQPWKAALLLSALGIASTCAFGMPLGITTSYAKLAATLQAALWPEHAANLEFFRTVPLDAALPALGIQLRGGPGPVWDAIASIQGGIVSGIVAGAAASALLLGEFCVRFRAPRAQYVSAFIGGVVMALGSRMGGGCNVWHLFGGLPVFLLSSILFAAAMVPGAWAGARLLTGLVLCDRTPAASSQTSSCEVPPRDNGPREEAA